MYVIVLVHSDTFFKHRISSKTQIQNVIHIFLFQDAHLHLLQNNNNNSTLDISITRSMKLQSIVVINIVYFLLLVILLVVVVHNR